MSSAFNDSEGLYRTTVWRCLVRKLHYSAANAFRVTWSERVRHRDALTEIAWGDALQGTRPGNVYRSVREKQGNAVYRQRVLQTVTSLRVVALVFRRHDLLQITNINP